MQNFQERLRELVRYSPDTGKFIRRVTVARRKESQAGAEIKSPHRLGYLRGCIDGRSYLLHRLAFFYMGIDPTGQEVDHINGDRTDNRWSNLRLVPRLENMNNMKRPCTNRSGVTGVQWEKRRSAWLVVARKDGKRYSRGLFQSFDEAVGARNELYAKLNKHPNHGR